MALTELNITNGQDKTTLTKNTTATAISGGATSLGGTIGARLLIDDAVITSRLDALKLIEILKYKISEYNWPIG